MDSLFNIRVLECEGSNIIGNETCVKHPMLNCVPFERIQNYDENQNNIPFKSFNTVAHTDTLSSKDTTYGHFVPVDRISKDFEELRIRPCAEKNNQNIDENKHVAGEINSIISTLAIALVRPLSVQTLLNIGTPLFFNYEDIGHRNTGSCVLLGHIDDILGNIGDPIYSVTITNESYNRAKFLNAGEQVYYLSNDPSTQFICIEHTLNTNFNTTQYKIKTKSS